MSTGYEDTLLRALWEQRAGRGWWLLEVPLGFPDAGAAARSNRRVDAVVLPRSADRISPYLRDLEPFSDALEGAPVELIEVKWELNMAVVGQLLCGASMFSAKYPTHGPLQLTALVEQDRDAGLRWYCNREGIEIIKVAPASQPIV